MYNNHYTCDNCGTEWNDSWHHVCNDKCPKCGIEVRPDESIERDINEMKFSVAIIDDNAIHKGQTEIIADNVTKNQYIKMAKENGFTIPRDDSSILGYYFIRNNGDAILTFPATRKKGETIEI